MRTRLLLTMMLLVLGGLWVPERPRARDEADAEITLALVGGWLIDGNTPLPFENPVILIAGNRIKAVGRLGRMRIPTGVNVIDAQGKFILPGLIDAHAHLEGLGLGERDAEFTDTAEKLRHVILQNARLDLLSGVTSLRDCGSSELVLKLREQIEAEGPRLFASGPQLVKRDPTHPPSPLFLEYDGAKDARRKVREQIAKGIDFVKVRLTRQRPLPTLEELSAIVSEARRAGLKVAAHIDVPYDEAVRLAVMAGVDTIEHMAPLRAYDDRLLLEMVRRNIILVPTLYQIQAQRIDPVEKTEEDLIEPPLQNRLPAEILQALGQRATLWRRNVLEWRARGYDPKRTLRETFRTLTRARLLGVKIALGPDTGSDLVPHGRFYKELALYASMGIPPIEVIQMATRMGAEALGREKELGTIEPGKLADLIVVDGDPLLDLDALRNVVLVIKDGRVIEVPRNETKNR
ncbi:MAG: amidohydrolase family protein [Blastocatellia bacterium]|nr:amidohydrolase family protein [Blastocatellia bacterium]MCS7157855.1 amidohydrolase family protein [Blastocatellia bacterium]MCX7753408.1 amidohydrolase family protein [Blastocatellia bacterium]MDW8168067.1 amidohydrolase family protein [Acidobacteriota bacterium]MDW8257684.1 amidohydrolase family protein [Acidobacteriota bacterium]